MIPQRRTLSAAATLPQVPGKVIEQRAKPKVQLHTWWAVLYLQWALWGNKPSGLTALQGSQDAQRESWGKELLIHYSITFLQQYRDGLGSLRAYQGGLNAYVSVVTLWACSSSEDTNSLLDPGSLSAPVSELLTDLCFPKEQAEFYVIYCKWNNQKFSGIFTC